MLNTCLLILFLQDLTSALPFVFVCCCVLCMYKLYFLMKIYTRVSYVTSLRKGTVAGTCDCGNEPSVSIKCGEFPGELKNLLAYQEGLCSVE